MPKAFSEEMLKNNPREVVLNALIDVFEKDCLSHIALRNALKGDFSKSERSFITRLLEGTIEQAIYLDFVIDVFSKTKSEKMKPFIRNALRQAVFELEFMDSIPERATCNETVNLVKASKFSPLSGFVNGVLRSIAGDLSKGKTKILEAYNKLSEDEKLEIDYRLPIWIIKKWSKDYGKEKALRLAKASISSNDRISVRMNLSKADKESIKKMLTDQGIEIEDMPYVSGLYLWGFDRLDELKAFKEGYIQPQDLSSMLVGIIAAPKKGDFCMDLCAAPGGKSLHLADLGAKVLSFDQSQNKVDLINENIKRSGFGNIEARVGDATCFNESLKESADLVLVDAPCSGLGVLAKKTDIKYKTKQIDIKTLSELQKSILKNAYEYLKVGGVLIYSTCTVNKNENDKNVEWLLKEFDLEADDLSLYLPKELVTETAKDGYIQLFQGEFPGDGFFISRMIKKG